MQELGYRRKEESNVLEIKETDGSPTQLQMETMELSGVTAGPFLGSRRGQT